MCEERFFRIGLLFSKKKCVNDTFVNHETKVDRKSLRNTFFSRVELQIVPPRNQWFPSWDLLLRLTTSRQTGSPYLKCEVSSQMAFVLLHVQKFVTSESENLQNNVKYRLQISGYFELQIHFINKEDSTLIRTDIHDWTVTRSWKKMHHLYMYMYWLEVKIQRW